MKRTLKFVLAIVLAIGVVSMFKTSDDAGAINRFDLISSQYPFETTVVTNPSALTVNASVGDFGEGSVIYGFRAVANDAADHCTLYDTATIGGMADTQGVFIDELTVATDEDFKDSDWPRPYVVVTDISVDSNSEACILYHDPKF